MKDLLKADQIQVNCEVNDYKEAISKAAEILYNKGMVKESFTEAVISREESFPTGLPTKIGVALPHTEEHHVFEEAISIMTLKNPVLFSGMGNPKEKIQVEIVFLLAIKNPEKQLGVLQKIVTIIQDENILKKIKAAKVPQTVYNLINQFMTE